MDNKKTDDFYELEFVDTERLEQAEKRLSTLNTVTIDMFLEYIKIKKFNIVKDSIRVKDINDLNRRQWALEVIDNISKELGELRKAKSTIEKSTQ